ncbi:Do family serine endopeptidase [Candidatus Bipolaricaulota sp. J31]
MRRWMTIGMLLALMVGAALATWAQTDVQGSIAASGQAAIHAAIDRVAPAVVRVEAVTKQGLPWEKFDWFWRFFGEPPLPERKVTSLGSGFVIEFGGRKYVLTNNHVVDEAEEVRVISQDGKVRQAKILGTDEMLDVAVLEVEGIDELPAAPIGDSDALRVGDWVIAIGNPLGFDYTVTLGIVSALNRDVPRPDDRGYFRRMIQTDAAINPGNSGGPLVNAEGEVVGMNTLIARMSSQGIAIEGINFAVPINEIMQVLPQLISKGAVTRAWLGVYIQDLTPQLAAQFGVEPGSGVLVSDVIPGSPAEKAGIQRGDIITAVDGKSVHNTNELQLEIMYRRPGDEVTVDLIREGKTLTVQVVLGVRPTQEELARMTPGEGSQQEEYFGMVLRELTPELARQYRVPAGIEGLLVVSVRDGSRADWAGVAKGDVIIEVNRKPVRSLAEWKSIIESLPPDADILLTVVREGRTLFLVLP